MAIMDSSNGDQDMMRFWSLLTEVSEQLSNNRNMTISLHGVTGGIKTQAIHSQTGFVLRRFNLDKPKEVYDAELERMNAAMSAENQTLQNDNKQLNALIREYEQAIESAMGAFRAQAYEVQQRELALMREYESVIIQRETEALDAALKSNNARSETLGRVGRLLRAVMRKLNGEDLKTYEAVTLVEALQSTRPPLPPPNVIEQTKDTAHDTEQGSSEDTQEEKKLDDGYVELQWELDEDEDMKKLDKKLAAAEWALERESELARLERENEELRNLLRGVLNSDTKLAAPAPAHQHPEFSDAGGSESGRVSPALSVSSTSSTMTLPRPTRQMGGPPGTVGPFGTYKRRVGG